MRLGRGLGRRWWAAEAVCLRRQKLDSLTSRLRQVACSVLFRAVDQCGLASRLAGG